MELSSLIVSIYLRSNVLNRCTRSLTICMFRGGISFLLLFWAINISSRLSDISSILSILVQTCQHLSAVTTTEQMHSLTICMLGGTNCLEMRQLFSVMIPLPLVALSACWIVFIEIQIHIQVQKTITNTNCLENDTPALRQNNHKSRILYIDDIALKGKAIYIFELYQLSGLKSNSNNCQSAKLFHVDSVVLLSPTLLPIRLCLADELVA